MWTLLARTAKCCPQLTLENTSSVDQPLLSVCLVLLVKSVTLQLLYSLADVCLNTELCYCELIELILQILISV